MVKVRKLSFTNTKQRKNYRRTQGHRQPYTKVEITTIKTASARKAKRNSRSINKYIVYNLQNGRSE